MMLIQISKFSTIKIKGGVTLRLLVIHKFPFREVNAEHFLSNLTNLYYRILNSTGIAYLLVLEEVSFFPYFEGS